MNEQKSPPEPNASPGIVRRLAAFGLTLLEWLGFVMTKTGKPIFDRGADLETWARNKKRGL